MLRVTAMPEIPSADEFIQMVSEHYDAMLSFYGTPLGVKVARKHLGWYMDEAGCDKPLRTAVLTAKTPAEVLRLLPDALGAGPERSAA